MKVNEESGELGLAEAFLVEISFAALPKTTEKNGIQTLFFQKTAQDRNL
jgi:hypothetical protein